MLDIKGVVDLKFFFFLKKINNPAFIFSQCANKISCLFAISFGVFGQFVARSEIKNSQIYSQELDQKN